MMAGNLDRISYILGLPNPMPRQGFSTREWAVALLPQAYPRERAAFPFQGRGNPPSGGNGFPLEE